MSETADQTPTTTPNARQVGELVTHTISDPYDGEIVRDAIVVETVPDDGDGGPKVVLAYLAQRTGNVPESQVTPVL